MAREIRRHEIDVLIDMDGYSNEGIAVRSLFATRLAPVTASWFVYMATTGQDNIDYIVADRHVLPTHVAAHHSEAVLELPGPGTFFPISHASLFPDAATVLDATATKDEWRAKHGLPPVASGRVVFASFNKHLKITPHVWASWMHVLRSVPGSVLLLLENPAEGVPNLREHFARSGLAPDRLVWCPFVNTAEEHIFRVAMADVILDTPPWGAHTGGADALWCAVPLVTTAVPTWESSSSPAAEEASAAADSMASRVALSLLHAAGVPELVAGSMAEYTATAVRLGRDAAWRAEMVAKLKAAREGPTFDAALYARTFVHGMHVMYAAACTGGASDSDSANAAQAGAAAGQRRLVVPPVDEQLQ
jgi:protein O-GlcNAc transferase